MRIDSTIRYILVTDSAGLLSPQPYERLIASGHIAPCAVHFRSGIKINLGLLLKQSRFLSTRRDRATPLQFEPDESLSRSGPVCRMQAQYYPAQCKAGLQRDRRRLRSAASPALVKNGISFASTAGRAS
jgi:hypothetical protein